MSEEEASAAPAAVEPEAAPADAGPLTAADIAGWLATSSANARMTSVGKRLGVTAYDQDVIRDFFQWNLQFIQDSSMPAEKGLVVFELLKAQREQSVGEKLSLEASLDAFQQRLLVATREPPPAVAEAAAEEVPPEEGAGAEDGGDADAAEGGEGGPEPAPAPPPPPPPPPALSVADVKNVTDFFLGTFFRHYELHQAVADEGIGTGRVPDGAPPHTSVRLDRPPAAGPVLLPLSAALSEADYFAQKQAAERAAEAAEAEAAAAAAAAVAGVSEVEAEGGGDGADESTAAEKAAAEEEAAAAAAEAEAEAAAAAAAAAAVAPEEDAAAEEGSTTDGPPTLEELLATAVAEQMAPVKAHLEVLMASNKAALLGQIAEAEARAN